MKLYESLALQTEELKSLGNLRCFPTTSSTSLQLSSNDYMGISKEKSLMTEFQEACLENKWEMGACSSRLLTGNHEAYNELEALLADLYAKGASLVFNSGYHANMGILPALTTSKDLIVADQFVHASMIDGIRLSNASFWRFRHQNYNQLETYLEKHRDDYENVFIVVESLYSMDGDFADLSRLVDIKRRFDCCLYVDEAHAFGVVGHKGLGLCEKENVISDVDFIVGTFGKAIASQGAFVACDPIIKSWLIQKSRTLIYTTALPEASVRWSCFVIQFLVDSHKRREELEEVSRWFSHQLGGTGSSPIVPYIVGSNHQALALSKFLEERNISVLPIRYPTVPKGTARLRFSLTAGVTKDQLQEVIDGIECFQKNQGV